MRESFKLFWKDYISLWKCSWEWLKKHWKGYIVLVSILTAIECMCIFKEDIKCKIEDIKKSKSEDYE